MKIISLSGWLQPTDTMQDAFPEAQPMRYDTFPNMKEFTEALVAEKPDAVIGWSLGGVLAIEALKHPEYRPQKIILLGSPFQFLASAEVPEGAKPEDYASIENGYQQDQLATAKVLQGALNRGMPAGYALCPISENAGDVKAWLPWLKHLKTTSFVQMQAVHQPEILVIHGAQDVVVSPAQAKCWSRIFPKVQVMIVPQASHAPHMQAKEIVQQAVTDFLNA